MKIHGNHEKSWESMEHHENPRKSMRKHENRENPWKSCKSTKNHDNPCEIGYFWFFSKNIIPIKKILVFVDRTKSSWDHYWWRYEWITTIRGLAPGEPAYNDIRRSALLDEVSNDEDLSEEWVLGEGVTFAEITIFQLRFWGSHDYGSQKNGVGGSRGCLCQGRWERDHWVSLLAGTASCFWICVCAFKPFRILPNL